MGSHFRSGSAGQLEAVRQGISISSLNRFGFGSGFHFSGWLTANHRLLVANRSEIAVRIMRSCHELGMETVAIYSHEDRYR